MVSLFEIFRTFFKIGAFTIGGGYAMLPLIQDEVCTKKNWATEEEFLDVVSIVNSLPGMLATNSSGFIGYKLRGVKGFAAAIAGCICPSIVIILILACIFSQFSGNAFVQAFFKGVRPCIVVIMANAVYKLGRKVDFKRIYNVAALAAAFFAIVFLKIASLYLVLAAIIASLIIFAFEAGRSSADGESGHDS